jgi:hypothetical protein
MLITNENIVVTEPQFPLNCFVKQLDIDSEPGFLNELAKLKTTKIDNLASLPNTGAKKQILCRDKYGYCFKRIESIMRCEFDKLNIAGKVERYVTYDIHFQGYTVDIPDVFDGSYATVDQNAVVYIKSKGIN